MNTPCNHTHTFTAEWLDTRLSFLRSFKRQAICESCLDDLEADEFIELLAAEPI